MLSALELQRQTEGSWLRKPKDFHQKLCGATFDSRNIQNEQIFFCWHGEKSDGHLYLEELIHTSILVVLVEKDITAIAKNFAILKVENSLQALHKLASFVAISCNLPIFALTGSNGKTTAKTWLCHLLSTKYRVLTNYKNFNNHIGCPITLLGLKDENFILLEIGTSYMGEIKELVRITQPHYSLLLNIGLAHIGHFQTIENITKEKMGVFDSPRLKNGFLPSNLKTPNILKKCTNYAGNTLYRCQIKNIDLKEQKTYCQIQFHAQKKQVCFDVIAYHLQETIPMLLAIGDHFQISFETILQKIHTIQPLAGRMEFIAYNKNRWIINDSYNANPTSVLQLLQTMALCKNCQKIAVIGNLAELETKLKISAKYLAENIPSAIDKIYFLGETGRTITQKFLQYNNLPTTYFVTEKELLEKLSQEFQKNTLLAFKASRCARLEKTLAKFQQKIALPIINSN